MAQIKLKTWQEYLSDAIEALLVTAIVYLGLIPGIPNHNLEVALAFGIVKAAPTGTLASIITRTTGGPDNHASKNPTP